MASFIPSSKDLNNDVEAHAQASQAESQVSYPSSPCEQEKQTAPPPATFPEGGTRAWCVAAGHGGVAFCTFGYVNSFG